MLHLFYRLIGLGHLCPCHDTVDEILVDFKEKEERLIQLATEREEEVGNIENQQANVRAEMMKRLQELDKQANEADNEAIRARQVAVRLRELLS